NATFGLVKPDTARSPHSNQCGQILETLKGNTAELHKLQILTLRMLISRRNQLDYQFEIYIVQPGYSFAEKNSAHSQVLASTESFVIDTYARKFRINCNA
ncbi:hypothetical protein, partial [Ruegeria sp. Ofav3-42]|uniref:hypothetical protein n=1 Tax=Ruegeria sp. Ofav3-42 TaxID=2917759 RepID=UPI001EF43BE8